MSKTVSHPEQTSTCLGSTGQPLAHISGPLRLAAISNHSRQSRPLKCQPIDHMYLHQMRESPPHLGVSHTFRRHRGPQHSHQLAARLAAHGRYPRIHSQTVAIQLCSAQNQLWKKRFDCLHRAPRDTTWSSRGSSTFLKVYLWRGNVPERKPFPLASTTVFLTVQRSGRRWVEGWNGTLFF